MCTVSVVTGYGMNIPDHKWTTQTWPPFKQLVEQAVKFDKIADQPDCIDPAKDEWMKRIEERITRLEAAAFRESRAT
jgi:predicted alpha/beta hydrolase family esterase